MVDSEDNLVEESVTMGRNVTQESEQAIVQKSSWNIQLVVAIDGIVTSINMWYVTNTTE